MKHKQVVDSLYILVVTPPYKFRSTRHPDDATRRAAGTDLSPQLSRFVARLRTLRLHASCKDEADALSWLLAKEEQVADRRRATRAAQKKAAAPSQVDPPRERSNKIILYDVGDNRETAEDATPEHSVGEHSVGEHSVGEHSVGEQTETMARLERFIRALRATPNLRRVPVIAVGFETHTQGWRAALHAGALDCIPYTVDEEELMHTLESATERHDAILTEVQRQVDERYHDIIGIIQHEFRTPMTVLLGYGEFLREALDGQIDREELSLSVDAILSGSHRLNRLIESFLFLSDLQYRRHHQLKLQPVAPEILWREVQAILRAEAEETGLDVEYAIPEAAPNAVVDPALTREALTRLFDNALRYTRPDSRRIRLAVEFDARWVCWIIEDEGPGMETTQVQRILEPFGQSHTKPYRPESASLSLAIVRRVAELHGGGLEVESWVNQGSRFCLRLPLRRKSDD